MASNQDLAIRPLGIGEIVDRAVALTVRHLRRLFPWMLLVQAPVVAVSRLALGRTAETAAALGDPAAALAGLKHAARDAGIALACLLLAQSVATAICAAVVAPSLWGAAAPPPPPRRALAVATAALASLAAFAILPALGALPGIALLLGARGLGGWIAAEGLVLLGVLAAFLLTVLWTLLAPAVAAIEGRGHVAAIRRSMALLRAPPGAPFLERPGVRASLVLLATFALALAVNVAVGVPRAVLGRLAGGGPALLPPPLSPWAEVPLALFEAVAGAALQPFSLVAVAVLYFDRRARREGLDLEAFARELEERP